MLPAVNVPVVAPAKLKVIYSGVTKEGSASLVVPINCVSTLAVGPTAVARLMDAPTTLFAVLIVEVIAPNDGAAGRMLCFWNTDITNERGGRLHNRIVSPVVATA